jgi:hypothetical protein
MVNCVQSLKTWDPYLGVTFTFPRPPILPYLKSLFLGYSYKKDDNHKL